MMAALTGGLASQASNASIAASTSTGVDEHNKIKLRLCYNGRFQQTPSQTWRFIGGEYFNESISYGSKYADFMFKLSEKFKTAVSVKYQAPGEELDPDSLISVQDDADLQELVEDYLSHLDRPGTPSKTFRIKVFVFMAAEEPLTPDEIMEGQTFFSGGRMASSDTGTDLHRLSDPMEAVAAYTHLSTEIEQAALHNVRQSVVNYPLSAWAATHAAHGLDAALQLGGMSHCVGEEALGGQEEDEQNIEECLAFIQQQQHAAAIAAASASGSAHTSRLHGETSFPEDPFEQGAATTQVSGGTSEHLQTLPSHISAFGEDGSESCELLETMTAATPDLHTAAAHLPSHISAFGDDLSSNLQAVCAALDTSGTDAARAITSGERAGCVGASYGGPRTQDSSFSLAGDAQGGMAGMTEPGKPDRQDSGDSLASLPKLVNPVHRLAKPDLKIISKIGEGAFGEVSVANAPLYGTVAVKWLKTERFGKHWASFGREAAMLADLNHPNVLRFYGVVTENSNDNTVIGIMTEYIRGGSLSSFLRMSRSLLPLRMRCELALAASNGLAYLHELRIVHFDLKPDNLLLDAPPAAVRAAAGADLEEPVAIRLGQSGAADEHDYKQSSSNGGTVALGSPSSRHSPASSRARLGRSCSGLSAPTLDSCEVPVVKVADFGLSKHKLNSTYVSSCRDLRGTLPYMAPELVSDPERVSEKADVWSLGVVMWEMLTREIPFQEYAPQQILMGLMCGNLHLDIPEWCEPEWRGLLEACLEPSPGNRPSMRELARQLEAIRDQQIAHEMQQDEQQQKAIVAQEEQQVEPAVQPAVELHQQEICEPVPVQQIQQQMQQLFAQPAPVQPPLPPPVSLLHRQQQEQQQVNDTQQHGQGFIQEPQQVNQQLDQLLTDECAWHKQQLASQHEHAARLALHGISLSAHAGVLAAVSQAPALVPVTGQLGLQHNPLQQLHLQQTCGLLQPPLPLQPPRGAGFIQPT